MSNEEDTKELIELERVALDHWNNGDPTGYLELYSDDFSYFDESTKARVDGLDAIKKCTLLLLVRYTAIDMKCSILRFNGLDRRVL